MPEKNWSGNVTYAAKRVEQPETITQAQELISGLDRVRMVGNATGDLGVGGAIYVANGEFEINNSQIRANQSGSQGSAIFARETTGSINQSDVSNNTSISGTFAAIESRDAQITVSTSTVDRNLIAINSTGGTLSVQDSRFLDQGTAIRADSTPLDIERTRFVNNGRAISFLGGFHELNIADSLFHGNQEAVRFIGVRFDLSGTTFQRQQGDDAVIELRAPVNGLTDREFNVTDSTFQFNRNSGIAGSLETINISNSVFHQNQGRDGGVDVEGNLFVRDSTFTNHLTSPGIRNQGQQFELVNSLIQSNGNSGVFLEEAGDVFVSNTRILDNQGSSGGAIKVRSTFDDSRILISNSLLARNRVTGVGGAIFVDFWPVVPQVDIVSSTIVQNRANIRGGVIASGGVSQGVVSNLQFHNSIVWGNSANLFPMLRPSDFNAVGFNSFFNDDTAGDSNVQFGGTANNNSDRFPGFVAWSQGDFRLAPSANAIDAGDNGLLVRDDRDVDGDLNVLEFVHDVDLRGRAFGGITDVGAFEFRA